MFICMTDLCVSKQGRKTNKLFCTIFIKSLNEPMQKYQRMLVSSLVLWLKVRFMLTLLCVGKFSLWNGWNFFVRISGWVVQLSLETPARGILLFTPHLSLARVCPWWYIVYYVKLIFLKWNIFYFMCFCPHSQVKNPDIYHHSGTCWCIALVICVSWQETAVILHL